MKFIDGLVDIMLNGLTIIALRLFAKVNEQGFIEFDGLICFRVEPIHISSTHFQKYSDKIFA